MLLASNLTLGGWGNPESARVVLGVLGGYLVGLRYSLKVGGKGGKDEKH